MSAFKKIMSALLENSLDDVHICDFCGCKYKHLAQHLRWCDLCDLPELASCSTSDDDEDRQLDVELFEAETTALAHALTSAELQGKVADDLAEERLEYGRGNEDVARLKKMVGEWVQLRDESSLVCLQPLLRKGITAEQVQTALAGRDIFKGIETAKKEIAFTQSRVAYIEPRVVQLSDDKDDKVVSFRMVDLLARSLQNKRIRRRTLEVSDRLKTGELYQKVPDDMITDAIEATQARFHPHLWRPATDEEVDDVRIPLVFNCDEVEVSRIAPGAHTCISIPATHTRTHCVSSAGCAASLAVDVQLPRREAQHPQAEWLPGGQPLLRGIRALS